MGCRRSVLPTLIVCIPILFLLLASIVLSTWPGVKALAQERSTVRGASPSSARNQPDDSTEAARIVAERLAAAFPRVEGLIIGFDGDRVLIDRGTAEGVFQGMELNVFREGEEFRHPLTGESLGRLDKDLGTVRVLHIYERYAEATVSKKTEKAGFRKGDRVRVSMARMIAAFPNVDVEGVSGMGTRSMTKELAAALIRTGRFELIDERQLRSMLLAEKNVKAGELAHPQMLKQLADKGKIQVLLLSRLTPAAEGISLDVQAYSTLTGNQIVLASTPVWIGGIAPDQPPRTLPPSSTVRPTVTTPQDSAQSSASSPLAPGKPSVVVSTPSEHVVLGPTFDGSMTALATGDLDGDGKSEALLARADRLFVFRIDGVHLRPLAEHPLSGQETIVMLEVVDVTGDGGAEVILSLSQKNRSYGRVLQWAGGKLRLIWEIPDHILRPLASEGNMFRLFGQAVAPGDQSTKPIYQYAWDGHTFRQGPVLDVPTGLSLLEFMMADLSGDGAAWLVNLKGGGSLEVRLQTGGIVGTYHVHRGATAPKSSSAPRILIDKKRDGVGPHILVRLEQETGVGVLGKWTDGKPTRVAVLKWDGAQFHEVREILISDGALADYAITDLGEGLGHRLLALVVRSGRLGMGKKSEVHTFRLQ